MVDLRRIAVIVDREFHTVFRSRTLLAVAGFFGLVVVSLAGAATGAPGGYVSLTLDLLAPIEVLVPVLAFSFIYRSVQGDHERGELDVMRTYPLSRVEYLVGVYLGRVVGLLLVVIGALVIAGIIGSFSAEEPVSFLATHAAGDTPVVFVRFVFLTAGYTLVVSSLAVAASAATRRTRDVLALSIGLLLLVAIGLDILLVGLLSAETIGQGSLHVFLGLSPASAFRGLVVETAVAPALAESPPIAAASPVINVVGLAVWLVVPFAAAYIVVWRE
jgi:ABC-type transport system involved in multi-copper enzyme maturation permease subunit